MKPYPRIPDGLRIGHDDGVLSMTLDRPDRRNSLTDEIVYALVDLFDAAASDEAVRVIYLTGTGDDFCSGFDLGERVRGPEAPRVGSIHRRMNGHVNRLIPAMLSCQVPSVCSARGWMIGLGLNLALACDFAVVAEDATLWAPFTGFGFTPDSGASWLVPRLAGVARAKEMLMLCEQISGADAATWGLVHRAVPLGEVDAIAAALVARLAASATVALGLTKLLVHNGLTQPLSDHLRDEAFSMEVSSRSEDFRESARARREKRSPKFAGR